MDDTPFIVPAVKGIEATLRESLGSGPNREAKGDRVETRKMRLALAPKIAEVEAKSCATKEAAQLHQLRTKEIHAQVAACMAAYEEHQTQRNREINATAKSTLIPRQGGGCWGNRSTGNCAKFTHSRTRTTMP